MSERPRVLFVCTGNVCRSAIAEHLLRELAKRRGVPVEVASRGTAAESYFEMPEPVVRLLREQGVPPFRHRPRLLTRDDLRWADLVLVMEEEHQRLACERFPEFSRKVRLLHEEAGLSGGGVRDPMGASDDAFETCVARIRRAVEELLERGLPLAPRVRS